MVCLMLVYMGAQPRSSRRPSRNIHRALANVIAGEYFTAVFFTIFSFFFVSN